MAKNHTKIFPSKLKRLLEEFTDLVYENDGYARLPYQEWRTVTSMTSKSDSSATMIDVNYEISLSGHDNWITFKQEGSQTLSTQVKDRTFGAFIEAELFPEVALNNISYITLDGDGEMYIDIDGVKYHKAKASSPWISTTTTANYNYATVNNYVEKTKEKEDMTTNKFANFDFGPVNSSTIRMSMYGLAVKNANGTWVSYDVNNMSIMDVDIFNFDGAKFLYKMPVALDAVQFGDVIIHARKPMFVTQVTPYTLFAVDPVEGEVKEIMPTKSPFGFNFITKVVNFVGGMFNESAASAENPFGNMWMLMMVGDGNKDIDPMMLAMMMSQGNMNGMNPMMLALMMGDNKDTSMRDMMLLSMMMGNQGHTCQCGNHGDVNGKERIKNNPFGGLGSDKKPVQDGTAPGEGNGGGTGAGSTTGGSAGAGARVHAHSTPEQISEAVKNDLARPSED